MSEPDRIDVHQHVVPPFWVELLSRHGGDPSGWKYPVWSPESALAFMDEQQIQTGILSLTAPGVAGWTGQAAADMARRVNEYTAGLVIRNPSRFGNFITLPLPDMEASLKELDYAYRHLNPDGVILLTNYKGIYLGDALYRPLWKALDKLGTCVFIHPAKPPMDPIPGLPGPLVDYPADTTRTALHMVVNGVIRDFENTRIILSHAGGFLPYASHRFAELLPGLDPSLTKDGLLTDMKAFYFDTALSGSHVALKSLLDFAKPCHVLYGSDYPYAPASVGASFCRDLDSYAGYENDQLERINNENGRALFKRLDT